MTIKELIDILKEYPQDYEVFVESNIEPETLIFIKNLSIEEYHFIHDSTWNGLEYFIKDHGKDNGICIRPMTKYFP